MLKNSKMVSGDFMKYIKFGHINILTIISNVNHDKHNRSKMTKNKDCLRSSELSVLNAIINKDTDMKNRVNVTYVF